MLRIAMLLVVVGPAFAFSQGDAMIHEFLARRTDQLAAKALDGAKSLDEWKQRRPRLYQEYMEMLGLWPLPEKTPLHASTTRTWESQGAVIENLHFQSKPGLYVTANFYRPKVANKKLPTILYVCGHSNRGRDGNKSAFQDHGLWFANNGYNCLIVDTLQLGEIAGIHHGTYNQQRWWWHSLGYSSAAVECWSGVRALDYLVARPEVDADRLGVTGISGGGAATLWIAAADDRVQVAVPVSGMSDLEAYVKGKGVNGHCDCMFLYNTHQWEWTTIAALVAPRPMLFANSDNDRIFPMDGNRRIIARLRELYRMHAQASHVDDYVSVGGHDYRPDLRIAIFQFFNRHLKNEPAAKVKDAEFTPIVGRELRVFPEDADIPKDAVNARADEMFLVPAKVPLPEKGKLDAWRQPLLKALRTKVFRDIPEPVPPATQAAKNRVRTQAPLEIVAELAMEKKPDLTRKAVWNMLLVTDTPADEAPAWVFKAAYGWDALYVVHPRGVGATAWTSKNPPNYVERAHALLGSTADSGRLYDVLAAFAYLREKRPGEKWKIAGQGKLGIVAAYAALLDPRIEEVILLDPTTSHKEGPHFLGVLRVLDVPDALGMLAPRPLTLVGSDAKAFERTASIYQAADAAVQFRE